MSKSNCPLKDTITTEKEAKMAQTNPESKMSKAVEIFTRLNGSPRKDVISAIQSELGMSKAGASTYYQNAKKRAGLVSPRAKA